MDNDATEDRYIQLSTQGEHDMFCVVPCEAQHTCVIQLGMGKCADGITG